jgi:hypothetical protein
MGADRDPRDGEVRHGSIAAPVAGGISPLFIRQYREISSYLSPHIAILQQKSSIERLRTVASEEFPAMSAVTKAIRRLLLTLDRWAAVAARALTHGVPA